MPTDSEKDIMNSDIFMKDQEGNIKPIGRVSNIEVAEKDDAADAIKYAVEHNFKRELTIEITPQDFKRFKKSIGLQTITRKRFVKLLMGRGIQRNDANIVANIVHNAGVSYSKYIIDNLILERS